MGFSLKKLFPKKPGGSLGGNLFRKFTEGVAAKVGLDGVVRALNPVPEAPAPVQEVAKQEVEKAASMPALAAPLAQSLAATAVDKVLSKGGTQSEADAVGQQVLAVAQVEPQGFKVPVLNLAGDNPTAPVKPSVKLSDLESVLAASKELGIPASEVPAAVETLSARTGKTKDDILTILKDGAVAAKDAMVQSWLDKTKAGQDTKKEAIWGQLEKYAPYAVGGIGLIWFAKRQGWIK